MVTTLVTLDKVKRGDVRTLIPSVASKANNTCDVVTDVVAIAPYMTTVTISFFSREDCGADSFLGHAVLSSGWIGLDSDCVNDRHDLHIPIFADGQDKKVYLVMSCVEHGSVDAETPSLTLRIGVLT